MGTAIVGLALLAIVSLIVRKMIKDKKQGKSIQCGCDCKHCGGHCHYKIDPQHLLRLLLMK